MPRHLSSSFLSAGPHLARAVAAAVVLLGGAPAHAAGAAPPAGWEARPAPAPRPRVPACCGYDELCCERQQRVDAPRPADREVSVHVLDVGALPEAIVRDATVERAGIPGAPAVRALDGRGRPFPWPGGPALEVRVLPPGFVGEISFRDDWSPFFSDPEDRSMGFGVVHVVTEEARDPLVGGVDFLSLSAGPGDSVVVDRVIGALRGSPEVHAAFWEHAEAAPVLDGVAHAYQRDVTGAREVVVLLPEVVRGFESREVELLGGFFPSRFSRSQSFSRFALPATAGRSASAHFTLLEGQVRNWFPRPAGAARPAPALLGELSASQTRAEPAPHVQLRLRESRAPF